MLSEVNFLRDRRKSVGTFSPRDTIVLHPYGRYCNANKFAGEVDVFEAIDSVRARYPIDDDRIVVRGFSMGGASTWHLAVHDPGRWAAANPGAGFAETPKFARFFHGERLSPTWWEQKLFNWYDCPGWCENLWHCPTVAYSGELDTQKQAADVMAEAMRRAGLELVHVIGPGTKHAYHPQARDEVDRRIAALAAGGRDTLPETVRFTTYTLRYNRCAWLTVDGLEEHWKPARVEARRDPDGGLTIAAENVTALTIAIPAGKAPVRPADAGAIPVRFATGGAGAPQSVAVPAVTGSDRSWTASFHRGSNAWEAGAPASTGLRKTHGLQGPIDDAFMEPFLFVRPTGVSPHPAIEAWVRSELERAVREWRRQFRGDVRIKDDTAVSPADIANMNLVLWGDASSNGLIARIADKLPIRYEGERELRAGSKRFDASQVVPVLIYPNPLDPAHYVVLNSGFTFREHAYLSNSLQVPKLPDWALVDVRTPPSADWPGKIVAAGFFDEQWRLGPVNREP
jgi:dienelactone hydrolase